MIGRWTAKLGALAACLALAGMTAQPAAAGRADPSGSGWVGSWATSQQAAEPRNALDPADLTDTTLRQVVRLSTGGKRLRIRISNAFGTAPMRLEKVHVARAIKPGESRIDPATDRAVTFAGRPEIIVPTGAIYVSDPVALAAPALSSLAISFHIAMPPARQTNHPGSRTTSYIARGDRVSAVELPQAKAIDRWFQIAGIDVESPRGATAIVTLGDSITDGSGATTNGDDRWPDILAERLQRSDATRSISVLNQGIGGNRLLDDGTGANALARVDRDVLAQPGVGYLILLEGVNDLGTLTREGPVGREVHATHVRRIVAAYQQIVLRARERGIRVFGATILPYGGSDYYHPDALNEADRQAVNRWIRTPGNFDAVIDFDRAARDPARPDRMLPAYDSGDHLHPSAAGYRAMAEAIPLSLFRR